jgi:hypothetical protein
MLRLGTRSSCRESFKKLDILTVLCLYISALMLFAVKYPNIYQTKSSVHVMNTFVFLLCWGHYIYILIRTTVVSMFLSFRLTQCLIL